MKNITIIGSFFGTDGYSSHTRQLFNALAKRNDTNMKVETQLVQGWNMLVNDNELRAITNIGKENDVRIIVTTPHNWKTCLGLGLNIGYCVWEGSNVPKSYIEEMLNDKIDLIFVPSNHTREAILNTINSATIGEFHPFKGWIINEYMLNKDKIIKIITDKIRVIPHGVDLSIFYPKEKSNDDKFRFICNKGWRGTHWDRGGVQYVIKAFAEEFRNNENVELLVKLNPAYIDGNILNQAITNLSLPDNRASIQIVVDNIPYNKLIDLYNKGNVYVCATRAEAFNLPGLEAMACGLSTIQTDFGGQTDYMTEENSLKIDYKLEEVKEDMMYEGCQWAVPSMISLRKQMRYAFEHPTKIKKMGEQSLEDVKNWTWNKSAEKVIEYLDIK